MATQDDLEFQKLVLANRLATPKQIDECLLEIEKNEKGGFLNPLSTIMIDKGYITIRQAQAIYQLQGKSVEYLIKGYTIIEKLGEGGLGIVYKAKKDGIGNIVALKVLSPHLVKNDEYIQRFKIEADIATKLNHPNIVRGIEANVYNGLYYFAMEFVDGITLKQYIKERGRFSEQRAIEIIIQVTEALQYAEKKNLVHRDIKPENIMIAEDGVKLCDLGLAKNTADRIDITAPGVVLGTPSYVSPEQAIGKDDLDIRSDIYSLGITFFEMVTGSLPFQGNTIMSIIQQHLYNAIPSPQQMNKTLSPEVCAIIIKMMEKNKSDRYQSPLELLIDLKKCPTSSLDGIHDTCLDIMVEMHYKKLIKQDANLRPSDSIIIDKDALDLERPNNVDQNIVDKRETEVNEPEVEVNEPEAEVNESEASIKDIESNIEFDQQAYYTDLLMNKPIHPTDNSFTRKQKKSRRTFHIVLALLLLISAATLVILNKKYKNVHVTVTWLQELLYPFPTKEKSKIALPPLYTQGIFYQQAQKKFQEYVKQIQPTEQDIEDIKKNMVYIPEGSFVPHAKKDSKGEQIKGFWIDPYEVTNAQYKEFCVSTKYPFPPHWDPEVGFSKEIATFPVVNVSFYDAKLYAKWAKKRLPTEMEWEFVAATSSNFQYPWGNQWQENSCNCGTSTGQKGVLKDSRSYPNGRAREKIWNMAGNVWEWTSSTFQTTENIYEDKVIKGGSFLYHPYCVRNSYRDGFASHSYRNDIGFRCVAD
ncbi:MAG TPA: bifunctional serine/threonine-protein kinase/formylglycine-generating enzyme family protein [Planctomycetota bacterium]|nr:bifunctional serine/threonine-protein kinase/formylglycine-generating enzyme family protein [Planctomycetota bacterium]